MMLNALVLLPSNKFTEQGYCELISDVLCQQDQPDAVEVVTTHLVTMATYNFTTATRSLSRTLLLVCHTHTQSLPPKPLSVLQVMGGGREKGGRGEGEGGREGGTASHTYL